MGLPKSQWPKVMEELEELASEQIGESMQSKLLNEAEKFGFFEHPDVKSPQDMALALEQSLSALKVGGARTPPPNRGAYSTPALLASEEQKREEVISWLVGLRAGELPRVREFRRMFVGDQLFTRAQAIEFLRSPAYRQIPIHRLALEGMPSLGLTGREYSVPPTQCTPGGLQSTQAIAGGGFLLVKRYGIHCEWMSELGEPQIRDLIVEVSASPYDDGDVDQLRWETGSRSESEDSDFIPGTAIDRLSQIAGDLALRTWWPKALTVWFILTGEAPKSPAIHVELRRSQLEVALQARLTLQIQPWVSHLSVRKAYRDAQRWALGRGKRAISVETLERFRFVHELRLRKPRMTWPEIAAEWTNHSKAKGRAKRVRWRTLWADYDKTKTALLLPDLALGRTSADMPLAKAMSKAYRREMLERFKQREARMVPGPQVEVAPLESRKAPKVAKMRGARPR